MLICASDHNVMFPLVLLARLLAIRFMDKGVMRSAVCLFILLLDQRCIAGSTKVSMRPDGRAGLGPDGHCDRFAQLGTNVCSESYGLLAFG